MPQRLVRQHAELVKMPGVGLDVYVGPLTRYYTGDWETVIEQLGRERGLAVEVIRPGGTSDDPEIQALMDDLADAGRADDSGAKLTDPAAVAEAVLAWRTELSATLGRELEWIEDPSASVFTDKPAWDGWGSIQVLAASVERSHRKLPKRGVDDPSRSKVWRKAANGANPRFQHLYFPELWLPVDLEFTFEAEEVGGKRITMGSSVRLLADLNTVNEATYHGTPDDIAQWRFDGAEYGGPFEDAAKFGLAIFIELATKSVSERLPMRLDY